MAFITQTLLNDNRLQLGREEFIRPHAFGGQWTRLRIGLHLGLYGPPGVNHGVGGAAAFCNRYCFFYVGLCEGVNGGISNPSGTPDALVCSPFTQALAWAPFTYGFQTPFNYYLTFVNPGRFIWKQGTTESVSTLGSTSVYGSCVPCRTQIFVDLRFLGNNQVRWDVFGPGSPTQAVTDITRYQFLANMETDSLTGVANIGQWIGNGLQTYTGNYNLDCVTLYWQRSQPTFEFSEIAVTRFF